MAKKPSTSRLDNEIVWAKGHEPEPVLPAFPKQQSNLLELAKLTRERNEIDYQIADAESAAVQLEELNLPNLVTTTRQGIELLKNRRADIDKILAVMNTVVVNKIDRLTATPPPARGKELNASIAYAYMDQHPDGKAIVAEEFWMQVNKEADNGCWEVRFEVTKNSKGTIKKAANIPWFGKAFPATRMAWYLTGQVSDSQDSNLYNECGNDKCVNPAHHYQGALGKIKKQLAREKSPEVLPATFQEMNEWVDAIFSYVSGKLNKGWSVEHGFTFKELSAHFVPDEIPTEDDMRKALNCKRGKALFTLHEGKWYAAGMQTVMR